METRLAKAAAANRDVMTIESIVAVVLCWKSVRQYNGERMV
jgi:hypothetical protein